MTTTSLSVHRNKLDLDRYVPALVTFLANKLSSGASACYRKHFDVGVAEWRVLALLRVESNITANRICQVIGLDKAAVSRALKLLKEDDYVTFVKDETDGRSVLISLTPSGEGVHDQILQIALQREALLLEGLTPAEQDTLISLLQKVNARVAVVNAYDPSDHE